jgi:hypothetical protein
MQYVPIQIRTGESTDVTLAKETDCIFEEDSAAGYSHAVMVRASTLNQADTLLEIYQQHTQLRLEVVHSGKSQRAVEKVVERLRQGELDGVICVNMLGEGFDLPKLKIAALHTPHRSLSVTLQFLGRFARINGEGLGDAKILAVQAEIEEDLEAVFQENEAWSRMVRAIGEERISREVEIREFLDEFQVDPTIGDESTLDDLSLYSFNLFNHVKIYHVHGTVNLHAVPELTGFITEKIWVNESQATLAFIAREEVVPKWTTAGVLSSVDHHMFVLYHDTLAGLLFICATCREDVIYKQLAEVFVAGPVSSLSLSRINRVLRSFTALELFNVGMRNRSRGSVAESYRQIAGSAAHYAIAKSDGTLYHRGHVFGRGLTAHGRTTIGLSSLSKIWRLESTKLPQLVKWCQSLARDIENPAPFVTGIAIDHLDAGIEITRLPQLPLLGADWQDAFYAKAPTIMLSQQSEPVSILDIDLTAVWSVTQPDHYFITLQAPTQKTQLLFRLAPFPSVVYADEHQPRWEVDRGRRRYDLAQYLSESPLRFHLADGSLLEGCQLFEASHAEEPFEAIELMEAVNWTAQQVDPYRSLVRVHRLCVRFTIGWGSGSSKVQPPLSFRSSPRELC